MPASLAIPLILGGASTATSLIGGKMASNAAKDAAATQVASADKALALQKQQYDASQARVAPYVAAGQQSLGRLSNLLTPNAQGQYMPLNSPQATPQPQPAPGSQLQPSLGGLGGPGPLGTSSLASLGQPSMPGNGRNGAMMGQMTQNSGMITMRAPDGSTKQVPASEEAHWASKGAVRA